MKLPLLLLTALALVFGACQAPFSADLRGSLRVTTANPAKTLLPASTTVTRYGLKATGPDGTVIDQTSADGNFTLTNLALGAWTLEAAGYDAQGLKLAQASTTLTIASGPNSAAALTLVPLAGQGQLSLTLTWPSDQPVTQVAGQLVPQTGSPVTFDLSLDGAKATATRTLASGSYLIILSLKADGVTLACPRMEGALVWANQTTTGSWDLTANDFLYQRVTSVAGITANPTVQIGATVTLGAAVTPPDATNPTLVWSSDAPTLATVDAIGKVTGIAAGTTTIRATAAADPAKAAAFALTVRPLLKVTYDPNGAETGTVPADAQGYLDRASVTVKGNDGTLVRVGYNFSGWNTQADGKGTAYSGGNTLTLGTTNLVLFAQWTAGHRVIYDANPGTGIVTGTPPVDGTYYPPGTSVGVKGNTSATPMARIGYQFAGWTTNNQMTGPSETYAANAGLSIADNDVTLYAVWISNKLSFSSSGRDIVITGNGPSPTGSFSLPPGVTILGPDCLNGSKISALAVPSSTVEIRSGALANSPNLAEVSFTSGTKFLRYWSFASCPALSKVNLSEGLRSIGPAAFARCHALTEITIPSTAEFEWVSDWWNDVGQFQDTGLRKVTILSSNTSITYKSFFRCPDLVEVNLPPKTQAIWSLAFSECGSLTSIALPEDLAWIGDSAFQYCYNLREVRFKGDSLRYLSSSVFHSCSNLVNITLPSGLSTIGAGTFSNCTSLQTVVFPSSFSYMGVRTFAACPALSAVVMPTTTPPIVADNNNNDPQLFSEASSGYLIYVPSSAVDMFQNSYGWNWYADHIVASTN